RRKTSPTTSVPGDATATPTTPTRIPAPRSDGARTFPARPSFASPTRASLARHNPQLLNRPTSAGTAARRSGGVGNSGSAVQPEDETQEHQQTTSSGSTTDVDAALAEEVSQQPGRRRSRSAGAVGGNFSARPSRMSRSPAKPTPRLNATDGAEDVPDTENDNGSPFKENIDPFKRGGLRRSPVTGQGQAAQPREERVHNQLFVSPATVPPSTADPQPATVEPDPATEPTREQLQSEPELPPTPTQRGIPDPVVTTPPAGIHNTPSKRPRRPKEPPELVKSSPLKPKPAPPREQSRLPMEQKENIAPRKPLGSRRSARFAIPEDPYAAKKETRDNLLEELKKLQKDVALATRETERLRKEYESGKVDLTGPPNPEELAALLLRSTEPEAPPAPKAGSTSIFKSINSFLPFSRGPRRPPVDQAPILDTPPPSHKPISVEDPLAHLTIFSPLRFTSNIVLLPPTPEADSGDPSSTNEAIILQKHLITARSPSGLFSSRFSMIVNPKSLSIISLDIEKLDPTAEYELGPFIRQKASDESVLGKDVGVICWAMARWFETALLRARFWCAVESEFGTSEARTLNYERYQQSNRKKRKRPVAVMVEGDDATGTEDDDATNNNADGSSAGKKLKWSRRQLLPHLGRTSMEIESETVELRLEWKIGFDWTGEVESSVSAATRLPKSWKDMDDRHSLAKIPETFDRLVKERGPLGAVRTI
ncbi:hypothetical protein DH86_00003408, partial [Scytalidium sp. 3C]